MNNKWIYIYAILLTISTALFLIKPQNRTEDQDKFKSSLEGDKVEALKTNIILNNQVNGKKLEVEIEDIYGNKIVLDDLRTKHPKLVYFYSELTCDVCVDQSFDYFNSFIKKAGAANAIVLVESSNLSYITTLMRLNQIKTRNVFRVTKKNIDFQNKGFFFLLDQSDAIHHTYFPMKEIPEMTSAYFHNLDQDFGLVK